MDHSFLLRRSKIEDLDHNVRAAKGISDAGFAPESGTIPRTAGGASLMALTVAAASNGAHLLYLAPHPVSQGSCA
jgi:hypothetical protein